MTATTINATMVNNTTTALILLIITHGPTLGESWLHMAVG